MSRRLLCASLLAAALWPWLSPTVATADPPIAHSAPALAPALAPPLATALADDPVPAAPTDMPGKEAWDGATRVSLDSPLPPPCRAQRLKEWLRVRCTNVHPGAGSVASGPSKDVAFYATIPRIPNAPSFPDPSRGLIEVIFPLRPGTSRLIQLTHMGGGGYDWFAQESLLLLSVQWPKSQERPIVLTDYRAWRDEDVLGMRIGGVEEAKQLDLPTKWGGPIILSVAPGSPADRGGAKPGDVISGLEHAWRRSLAFGAGPRMDLLVMRKGTAKQIRLPRRPSSQQVVTPP